jgi:carbon-monoxide dehydrogenase medium subunit
MTRPPYFKPGTLLEAWDLMDRYPGGRFIAGATDLFVKLRNREARPPALISLRSVSGLSGIEPGEPLRIGACTTISDIVRSAVLREKFPLLVQGAQRLGSVQIRNVATIGGNLCNCSPCSDTATPLLVMEARVRLSSPGGVRELPIGDFFLGPGQTCAAREEILTDILLDPQPEGCRVLYQKKGRVSMDLAVASVASLLVVKAGTCERTRIAAGSCAPVPLRLKKVEALLEGKRLTAELAAEAGRVAAESVSPITDVRATEDYRRAVIGVYVRRAVIAAMEGGAP